MKDIKKDKIKIVQYKWAGNWGPFKIKIPCGECGLSEGVIEHVIKDQFPDVDIDFEVLPWLNNWYKPILKGGWHAPIVEVNGKMIAQGKVIDSGLLAASIRDNLEETYKITKGNIVFSKEGCPHCDKAKEFLDRNGIKYEVRDAVKDPFFAAQMFNLVKKIYPADKPVTVPQIWLDGKYFGVAEDIERAEKENKFPFGK